MPRAKIDQDYTISNELCSYCNTNKAKVKYKNGKFCCEETYNSCPTIRKKNTGGKSGKNNKSEKWFNSMKNKKKSNQYIKAKELGLHKPEISEKTRQKMSFSHLGKIHSDETKRKLSNSMNKFILNNPKKVGYLINHCSKGPSYPEKYFCEVFKNENIKFETEKQIGLYSLDFTFPNTMIDLEINGEQHYTDLRIIESDKRRYEYLKSLGYTIIIIIRWSEYCKLSEDSKKSYIKELKEIIMVNSQGLEP